ncbi:hypothetical protein Tco_0489500 [Tanacetum coccineum]
MMMTMMVYGDDVAGGGYPVMGSDFGLGRKCPPEKFSGGGRWWPAAVEWPDMGGGRERIKRVSGKTEKLSGMSFHIEYIKRISLTGFPAQSVGSSNTDVLDLPCFIVLITIMSQSRQHDNATYSASADDITVQSCFFNIQLTNLSPRNCIPSDVLLRVSIHPAWSASEKAVSSEPEPFGY